MCTGINKDSADSRFSLPGQRMSACTCAGEDHAGPHVSVGRGVPEIDIIEVRASFHHTADVLLGPNRPFHPPRTGIAIVAGRAV